MIQFIMFIATGGYSGYLPKAPGTWGTLVALPINFLLIGLSGKTYGLTLACIFLLAVYSAGLAIPFLMTAMAINSFFTAFAKIRRHYHAIEIASGLLMVAIGVLIFTNRFTIIAQWLTPYLPVF